MPEVHFLIPALKSLQKKGLQVALVTDGRLSGASGQIPAAIHLHPEAMDGGPIAGIENGDIIELDIKQGKLNTQVVRRPKLKKENFPPYGYGRELFSALRLTTTNAEQGATTF